MEDKSAQTPPLDDLLSDRDGFPAAAARQWGCNPSAWAEGLALHCEPLYFDAVIDPVRHGWAGVVKAVNEDLRAGGTLLLLPGEFIATECLHITKEVHIFGQGAAVIKPAVGLEESRVFMFDASGTIDGVHIHGVNFGEALVLNSGDVQLSHMSITSGGEGCAVKVSGVAANPTIIHSKIQSKGDGVMGILFAGGSCGRLVESEISGHGGTGVFVIQPGDRSQLDISRNVFKSNTNALCVGRLVNNFELGPHSAFINNQTKVRSLVAIGPSVLPR